MSYFKNINFDVELALGNIEGQSGVNKFGANKEITAGTSEDIWDVGGAYPFPDNGTAPITHIHSSSASDTEPIEIQGLDINGDLTVETITLNGTTLTALTPPLWRVFRLKNMGTSDLIGTVDIVDSGDVIKYGEIQIGNNQTLMSIYTVPRGKTALLTKYHCTVIPSTNKEPISTRFGLWMKDTTVDGVFQIKHAIGIPKAGSIVEHAFNPYGKISELVDIKVNALPLSEDADVAAGFDLILVDN